MRNCRIGILLVGIALLSSVKVAAETADAKQRAARRLCLSGDFAKGVAILSDLFVRTKNPTFIYNQGRCFEQNRRYEDAIARFQEYLRVGKKISSEEKVDAEKHIADCKELLGIGPGQQAVTQNTPPAPQVPSAQPAPVAPVYVPPPPILPQPAYLSEATQLRQKAAPPSGNSGAGLRVAGIITASVGAAALIAGVVLNLTANGMVDDLEKTNGYSASKVSDRSTYETLGWVGYGVGTACVLTGTILYILGHRSAASPGDVALLPSLAPGQAGIVAKGAF